MRLPRAAVYSLLWFLHTAWVAVKHTAQFKFLPPTYARYYEIEQHYPQHNVSLPFPEGRNGKFLCVYNRYCSIEWNNIFQALILNTHMTCLSNRAWVFEPYAWDRHPSPYSTYNGLVIPSRIPLSTLVDGPISRGPFPPEHPNPLSIKELNEELWGSPSYRDNGEVSLEAAQDGRGLCGALFYGFMEHPFDWMQIGDSGMETVVPMLSECPILRDFRWSSLVLSAVRTNAPNFAPHLSADSPPDVVQDL
ncbi:hypothetical protein ACEPAG_301 [Sanghuangporus baumii]